jgi:hypothetical protein
VNTVLFLGFSLEDPDIDHMLDRLASVFSRTNEFHYALVESGRFSALEQRRLALDKRIRIIEYDNSDGKHEQVAEFLEYLYELTAPAGALRSEYERKMALLSQPKVATSSSYTSVFISYAGEDKPFVRKLASDLKKAGISVWYDAWMIRVGDSLVSKIEEGIRNADFMLVVLSKAFFAKNWPHAELNAALARENDSDSVFVLPIIIDEEAIKNMPPTLLRKRFLNFKSDYRKSLKELIATLKASA